MSSHSVAHLEFPGYSLQKPVLVPLTSSLDPQSLTKQVKAAEAEITGASAEFQKVFEYLKQGTHPFSETFEVWEKTRQMAPKAEPEPGPFLPLQIDSTAIPTSLPRVNGVIHVRRSTTPFVRERVQAALLLAFTYGRFSARLERAPTSNGTLVERLDSAFAQTRAQFLIRTCLGILSADLAGLDQLAGDSHAAEKDRLHAKLLLSLAPSWSSPSGGERAVWLKSLSDADWVPLAYFVWLTERDATHARMLTELRAQAAARKQLGELDWLRA